MAKGKKKTANKKLKGKVKKNSAAEAKKPEADELSSLKKAVEQAKQNLENAQAEANELQRKAQELVAEAKNSYREALLPYREACKKAGVECAFPAGRLANVSERVTFLVERVDDGIKVTIKGNQKPKRSSLQKLLTNPSTRLLMDILKSILDPKKKPACRQAGRQQRWHFPYLRLGFGRQVQPPPSNLEITDSIN